METIYKITKVNVPERNNRFWSTSVTGIFNPIRIKVTQISKLLIKVISQLLSDIFNTTQNNTVREPERTPKTTFV